MQFGHSDYEEAKTAENKNTCIPNLEENKLIIFFAIPSRLNKWKTVPYKRYRVVIDAVKKCDLRIPFQSLVPISLFQVFD